MNAHAGPLMLSLSNWFQHLTRRQGQAHEADPWLAHDFLYNWPLHHIDAPVQQPHVVIMANSRTSRYVVNQILTDINVLNRIADECIIRDRPHRRALGLSCLCWGCSWWICVLHYIVKDIMECRIPLVWRVHQDTPSEKYSINLLQIFHQCSATVSVSQLKSLVLQPMTWVSGAVTTVTAFNKWKQERAWLSHA